MKKFLLFLCLFLNFQSVQAWRVVRDGAEGFIGEKRPKWKLVLNPKNYQDCEMRGRIDAFTDLFKDNPYYSACEYEKICDNIMQAKVHLVGRYCRNELSRPLPRGFFKKLARLTFLKKLYLSDFGIHALPENMGTLIHLQDLDLYDNRLVSLPKSFKNLKDLEVLKIARNRFQVLPECIWALENLRRLEFWSNQVREISPSISKLQHLEVFHGLCNQLESLPNTFGALVNLRECKLSSNKLEVLPASFGNLKALTVLEFGGNAFDHFPEVIGDLTYLRVLRFSSDTVTAIPECIGHLPWLGSLYLGCKNLRIVPRSFLNFVPITELPLPNGDKFARHTSLRFSQKAPITPVGDSLSLEELRGAFGRRRFEGGFVETVTYSLGGVLITEPVIKALEDVLAAYNTQDLHFDLAVFKTIAPCDVKDCETAVRNLIAEQKALFMDYTLKPLCKKNQDFAIYQDMLAPVFGFKLDEGYDRDELLWQWAQGTIYAVCSDTKEKFLASDDFERVVKGFEDNLGCIAHTYLQRLDPLWFADLIAKRAAVGDMYLEDFKTRDAALQKLIDMGIIIKTPVLMEEE